MGMVGIVANVRYTVQEKVTEKGESYEKKRQRDHGFS